MSRGRFSDWFWFLARVFVGLVFAYAGFMKLVEPRANFEAALANYPILPDQLIPLVALAVPWCEWILGMCLILGYASRLAASGIGVLLVAFLLVIGALPLLGGETAADCGCFGRGGIKLNPKAAFVLDAVALGLVLVLILKGRFPWSMDVWLKGGKGKQTY